MSRHGDRLRELAARAADQGGPAAAAAMARVGREEIQAQLTTRSHARGTPTPAAPGQPPARISGRLHDHITVVRPVQTGAHRWVAMVGPTDVPYARIQERGGVTGRGYRTVIPPRPYMVPGARAARESGRARAESVAAFRAVVHGR